MEDSEFQGSESQDQTAKDHKPELPAEIEQPSEFNQDGSTVAEKWSSGLFACCNNSCNALVTVLLPCVTFGQVAEMVDEGNISCCISAMLYLGSMGACCIGAVLYVVSLGCISRCMPCKLSSNYRTKLRTKFNIPESPAPDRATHYFCECCALCQEYRELQSRGFDPSLGLEFICGCRLEEKRSQEEIRESATNYEASFEAENDDMKKLSLIKL